MIGTLEMMKSIITGKEEQRTENELIQEYQKTYLPNILAYFYSLHFGIINRTSLLYPILNDDDKASFCLQELDKCLQKFDFEKENKFITYFIKCYRNRLRMETEALMTQKRKANICFDDITNIDIYKDFEINDVDLILENYNLTDSQKKQCKLLHLGYSMSEISKMIGKSISLLYKERTKIQEKILQSV